MPWNGSTWVPYDVVGGNYTDFTGLIQYSNSISGDIFGIMLLVSAFIVIFMAGSTKGKIDVGLSSAMFVTTILSYLLVAMGGVGDWVAWTMTILLVASVVVLYRGGESDV